MVTMELDILKQEWPVVICTIAEKNNNLEGFSFDCSYQIKVLTLNTSQFDAYRRIYKSFGKTLGACLNSRLALSAKKVVLWDEIIQTS